METILSYFLRGVLGVFWIAALIIASVITIFLQVFFFLFQAVMYRHPLRVLPHSKVL
jgi:hypothetical protein